MTATAAMLRCCGCAIEMRLPQCRYFAPPDDFALRDKSFRLIGLRDASLRRAELKQLKMSPPED